MNFFERQRQVRRTSTRLVVLFLLAVIGIVLSVDLVVLLITQAMEVSGMEALMFVALATLVTLLIITLSSLIKTAILRRGGGGHVARSLGAVPVPPNTTDPQLRRLRNVVEEIAIASGVPVPELYVLEDEPAINAFAAGWSPADAAVAVTRGALDRLNRDELQGVIAHEFSHIVNGDMRLNIRLMGLLFGILVLSIVGRVLVRIRGQRNPLPLVGLALIVVGAAGLYTGRLIKAAVSRQREYLADASAVQFTRQTAGLVGALKKIAALPDGSQLDNGRAEDVSHMLFGSGRRISRLFATHPPLLKRIQVLDPTVSAEELEQLEQRWWVMPPDGLEEDQAMGLVEGRPAGPAPRLPEPAAVMAAAPAAVVDTVGTVAEPAHHQAQAILQHLPPELTAKAHDPAMVVPLVFGLLLSSQPGVRANQHAVLVARHGQALADAAWHEGDALAGLHPLLRLPLAQVAFPALRQRPHPEQNEIVRSVHRLITADGRLSVSEYCLSRLMHQSLYEANHHQSQWGRRLTTLAAVRPAALTLLACLAQAGHTDATTAAQAFQVGATRLFGGTPPPYQPPAEGVTALEQVWPDLDGLVPEDKERLVQALVEVVSYADGVTVPEAEMLRLVCAMLHCPLPPLTELAGAERPR